MPFFFGVPDIKGVNNGMIGMMHCVCVFLTALTLLSKVSRLIDMVATREGLQNTFENTIILYVYIAFTGFYCAMSIFLFQCNGGTFKRNLFVWALYRVCKIRLYKVT